MKSEELRALQAPLKERYREQPEVVYQTLRQSPEITVNLTQGRQL